MGTNLIVKISRLGNTIRIGIVLSPNSFVNAVQLITAPPKLINAKLRIFELLGFQSNCLGLDLQRQLNNYQYQIYNYLRKVT